MSDALLPCPLCGRAAKMVERDGDTMNVMHRVVHEDDSECACPMDTFWCDLGPEIAAKRWNRRVPSPAAVGEVSDEMVRRARDAMADAMGWPDPTTIHSDVVRAALAAAGVGQASGSFHVGDRVRKIKGSEWVGLVVGTYRTDLTPEGYAVESEAHKGSVQIYPANALVHAPAPPKASDEMVRGGG